MRWQGLLEQQPRLESYVRERLVDPGVVLLVTVRKDGTPRLSPVEPWLMDGELWLSMMWGSRKAGDVARDPRVLVHSIISRREGDEGEVKVRGRVLPADEVDVQQRYADAVSEALGWSPEVGRFHLFRVDVEDVTVVRYDSASADQYVARWPAGTEFVRRGTSATSVGDPEPIQDLLAT